MSAELDPKQKSPDMRTRLQRMRAFRREMEMAVEPLAYSARAGHFTFRAPISDTHLLAGSYVTIEDDQTRYLGQVITRDIAVLEGPELGFDFAPDELGFAGDGVRESVQIANQLQLRALEGEGTILGHFSETGFTLTANYGSVHDALFRMATDDEVRQYLTAAGAQSAALEVGQLMNATHDAPVSLRAGGFNRHTFLCGQSGSGKTFALGVVIEQLLLETELSLIIIDPNSDFTELKRVRSLDEVNRSRRVPLSARAYEEHMARYQRVMQQVHIFRPKTYNTPHTLQICFGDLDPQAQALVLQLDPLANREEYNMFARTIERLSGRTYSIGDVQHALIHDYSMEARSLALRLQNLGIANWEVWAPPEGGSSLIETLDGDARCVVIDTGSLALPAEKSVVVQAVLSHLWRNRHRRKPFLVVMDEAHNICPQTPEDNLAVVTTNDAIRIAGEGRKFGLYLLLASQRPEKLHANVLSQCDNLMLMRMNSQSDLAHVQRIFSQVSPNLLERAIQFGLGQSLVAGRIVRNPTFVQIGGRLSQEGGGDVPTSWAAPKGST